MNEDFKGGKMSDNLIDQMKNFHPRAWKLMAKFKPFLVVAIDEPYFFETYSMIRASERCKGTWTAEDEGRFRELTAKNSYLLLEKEVLHG